MHDWKKVIRQQMATLNLPPDTREEVIAELASHVEDCDDDGSHTVEGAATLDLTGPQWRELARAIQHAKCRESAMNNRTKTLWFPAFVNLVLSSTLLFICGKLGFGLHVDSGSHIPLTLQPWLFALPVCGATAALLARRGEGSSTTRFMAALAPSLVWLVALFILGLIFISFPNVFAGFPLNSLAGAVFDWAVLPALALLLGAAPFLEAPVRQA